MQRKTITLTRIVRTGALNFIRNASLAIAAMAVMIVTLTIILFSVVTNATFSHTIDQITNKIDVSVYLKDSTTKAQTDQLIAQLKKQPNVRSVQYLDKQQAASYFLQQDQSDATNLQQAVTETGNPIPATIHVFPRDLNKVKEIETFLTQKDNAALQTDNSPSYSGDRKEAIDNITHATDVLREIGVIAVIIFAVISALIIFNTIQMAIFNRREEISIMRLLGASTWYIRGPFIVESAIYGILSALISALIINGAFATASGALQASSLGLLDIGYANDYFGNHFLGLLTMQVAIGIVIGAASSVIATRRYLKFKTAK